MERPYTNPLRKHDRDIFFKYTSAETAKLILETRRLRWSSPRRFNDPFDVPQELYVGVEPNELQDALFDEVARIIESPERVDLSGQPVLEAVVKYIKGSNDEEKVKYFSEGMRQGKGKGNPEGVEVIKELQALWDDMHPKLRILCLSEIHDNTPMWNHYAGEYKGIVLAFHCSDELDSPLLTARRVTYQAERPKMASKDDWIRLVTGQISLDFISLLKEHLYVKTEEWSYESEWRVVSFARDDEEGIYSDYLFNPLELAAVYLGPCIDARHEADIRAILDRPNYHHVEIYKGRFEERERRIVFDKVVK